jgi:hypothetical protein
MPTFLPEEDVGELTGYKRKAGQRARLAHMGIPFHVNRFGRPLVMKEALLNFVPQHVEAMPDLQALEQLDRGTQTTH